jgi:predicted TIM-barrel enzyme
VSATAAGSDVNTGLIASVKKKNPEVAVLVNTGCRPDTIREKLSVCDAAVVGTYFKEGGLLEDENLNNVRVDVNRVREFMKVVRDVRSEM